MGAVNCLPQAVQAATQGTGPRCFTMRTARFDMSRFRKKILPFSLMRPTITSVPKTWAERSYVCSDAPRLVADYQNSLR